MAERPYTHTQYKDGPSDTTEADVLHWLRMFHGLQPGGAVIVGWVDDHLVVTTDRERIAKAEQTAAAHSGGQLQGGDR